jgi:hypothetical protein
MNKSIQKLCQVTLLLLLLLVGLINTSGHAYAVTCGSAIVSSGSCDVAVAGVVDAGLLTMTTVAAAVVTSPLDGGGAGHIQLNGSNQTVNFKIVTTVVDARGGTAGWKLQANSSGITIGGATAPVLMSQLDNTTSCVSTCSPTVAQLVFTPGTLTTSATTFLSTGNPGSTVDSGNYALDIDGSFILPSNASLGVYTGAITLTLASTF